MIQKQPFYLTKTHCNVSLSFILIDVLNTDEAETFSGSVLLS